MHWQAVPYIYNPLGKYISGPPGIPVLEVKNSPPPLSVKIPENSRYEMKIPPYTPCVTVNLSKSSFIYQLLLINPSSKAFDSDQIRLFDFPNIHGRSKIRQEITYQWLRCKTEIANNTRMDRKTNNDNTMV